jgi:hypothetical protein
VRSSFGKSGQRPGFRQADTYLSGVAVTGAGASELSAVVIGGTGNSGLKPEISTEVEVGLDASFLRNRLGVTYTYFDKKTRDALISQTLAPSLGVSTTRYVNLGKVSNSGHEIQVTAKPVDVRNARLDLTFTGSTLSNRLLELGGVPPLFLNGSRQRHQEGYPLGAFFQRKYTYEDKNADGIISRVGCVAAVGGTNAASCEVILADTASAGEYIGAVLPTRELSVTPTLTLFRNFRFAALVQHRGGNFLYNNSEEFRCTSSSIRNCRAINDPTAPLEDQAAAIAYALNTTSAGYIEKGDFTRLREVSAAYTLPASLARRARAEAVVFTIAGRNLKTWTGYKGFDPEVNTSSANFTQADFLTQPSLRTWTARIDVSF